MLMTNNSICLHQILNVSGMRALNFMISSFVLNKTLFTLSRKRSQQTMSFYCSPLNAYTGITDPQCQTFLQGDL